MKNESFWQSIQRTMETGSEEKKFACFMGFMLMLTTPFVILKILFDWIFNK
jgi:hypothetical protein